MAKYPIPFGRDLLLLERINVGGMAEVFRAKAFGVEGFERVVAVKRILPALAEDEEFIEMFIDEARIAANLTHQNIVQIYELGKSDDMYFISMEYIAGRDLRQILDRQQKKGELLDHGAAAFILSRVCEALDYAHRKRDPAGRPLNIIHRDVTPQNVILSYEGEVKLCDFGIAKAATRMSRTQVGVLKGKYAYMAPEQVQGHPVDHRGDIFALGVIFYEMLTGKRLFLGETDYATLEAVRVADIPSPRTHVPDLPEGLEKVVMGMLARDPEDRYAWASDVQDDLLEAMIQSGQLYQSRHLRDWMQSAYAAALNLENAKMEMFMRLDRPTEDRVEVYRTEDDDSATADYPALPSEVLKILKRTSPEGQAQTKDGRPIQSPVSSIFGTPQIEDSAALLDREPEMVRPAGEDPHERTVFDSVPASEINETLLGGPVPDEVSAAQAEIREMLERPEPESGSFGRLSSVTNIGDDTTIGGEEIHFGTFDGLPEDDPEDLTSIHPPDANSSMETVFTAEDDTPMASLAVSLADRPSPPRVGSGMTPIREAPPPSPGPPPLPPEVARMARVRSMLRSSPVREVNASAAIVAVSTEDSGASGGIVSTGGVPVPHSAQASFHGPAVAPSTGTGGARLVAPVEPTILGQRPVLWVAGLGMAALLIATIAVFLPPRQASLKVLSKPVKGAQVYIDGSLAGQTPVRIEDLAVGSYRVRLEAKGFETYRQTIRIRSARPHTMVVPLEMPTQSASATGASVSKSAPGSASRI
ncbi:MAG: serine/threonine-protein kinase, partial [Myxococcota bacterium]